MANSDDKYCKRCGKALKLNVIPVGYHSTSGKGKYKAQVYCPNKHLKIDGHTRGFIKWDNTDNIFYYDDDSIKDLLMSFGMTVNQRIIY